MSPAWRCRRRSRGQPEFRRERRRWRTEAESEQLETRRVRRIEKLDARLEGDAREHVDTLAESLLDRAAETVPEMAVDRRRALAREAALLMYQKAIADGDLIASENGGRGFGWEREHTLELDTGETVTYTESVANPVWRQSIRLGNREHRIWDELQLWPTA